MPQACQGEYISALAWMGTHSLSRSAQWLWLLTQAEMTSMDLSSGVAGQHTLHLSPMRSVLLVSEKPKDAISQAVVPLGTWSPCSTEELSVMEHYLWV